MGKSASKPDAPPPQTDLDMLLETVVAYYESTRATVASNCEWAHDELAPHYEWSRNTSLTDCLGEEAKDWVSAELSVLETALLAAFFGWFLLVRVTHATTPMRKTAELDMAALNRVNIFKECFLGYLGAGMLEPIMAIAGNDSVSTSTIVINLLELCGLFSWLYLLSDAFDTSDTQQAFVYYDRIRKDSKDTDMPRWLKKARKGAEGDAVRGGGSFFYDMSLWSMLSCSFAACCGVVSHREVIHSHAICLLWFVMHHQCVLMPPECMLIASLLRCVRATAWRGTGYWHTLFSPSAALLPLEYCLNLIDQEMIGDHGLEDLAKWRQFIKAETGVELTIIA